MNGVHACCEAEQRVDRAARFLRPVNGAIDQSQEETTDTAPGTSGAEHSEHLDESFTVRFSTQGESDHDSDTSDDEGIDQFGSESAQRSYFDWLQQQPKKNDGCHDHGCVHHSVWLNFCRNGEGSGTPSLSKREDSENLEERFLQQPW